ncbi:MAG: hypothetical protein R3B09_32950 [Nannocystaceae bacterium]
MASRPLDRWCRAALALTLAGCGGRSAFSTGAFDSDGDTDTPSDTEDEREGGCDHPIELPFAAQTVRGRVVGGGRAGGWCGEDIDGGDRGGEDTYLLTPPYSTDVILTFREGTDFPAILRVTPDVCYETEGVLPEICAEAAVDDSRYFLAEAGHTYNITVDSPAGTDGRYVLDIVLGWPALEVCPIHPATITQEAGGYFQWANDLPRGQGRVDGFCGGPGTENMFRMTVNEPSFMSAVIGYEGIQPVVSVRSSCAVASELECDYAETTSGQLSFEHFFDAPGEYYLVIDQGGIDGGSYSLEVFF